MDHIQTKYSRLCLCTCSCKAILSNLLFSIATQEFLCYLQGCEIAGRDAFSSVLMPVENRDGLLTRNCCSFVDKMVKLEQKLKALGGSQNSRVVHPQESVFRLPLGDTEENRTIYQPFTMNTDSQVFWEWVHMRKQSIQGRFLFYHTAWE